MNASISPLPLELAPAPRPLATWPDASCSDATTMRPGLVHLSTRSVPPAQRLNYWNELATRTFGPMVFDAQNGQEFHAEIAALPLGEGDLTSSWSGPFVLECKPGIVQAHAPSTLNLAVHVNGLSVSRHGGRTWQMRPGDIVLVDPSRPFIASAERSCHMLTLRLPRTRIIERLGDVDRHIGIRISGSEGPGAALSSLIRGLWPAVTRAHSEGWAAGLIEVVSSLIELVYKSDRSADDGGPSTLDIRRAQVRAHIERHFQDPDLDTTSIAASLGISARYVQRLFAPLGMTPSAYILERRLHHAAVQIRRERRARIGDIAYEMGFTDLSYFCRAFRGCFGQTPRQYRQRIGA